MLRKNWKILISVLLILNLTGNSKQDAWWNLKQQGGYGNMPEPSQPSQPQQPLQPQQPSAPQEPEFVPTANSDENLVTGITFDCSDKPTGPNKDTKYCDIYHACVFGKQQKTYGCAQNGDRFYYDDKTQKCEFSSKNPQGCPSGSYYTPLTPGPSQGNGQPSMPSNQGGNQGGYGQPSMPSNQGGNQGGYGQPSMPSNQGGNQGGYGQPSQPSNNWNNYQQPAQPTNPAFQAQTTQVPFQQYGNNQNFNGNNNNNNGGSGNNQQQPQPEQVEPWKQYVRQNEQFSCDGKQDGFYPSKWCNVYYRCFNKIKYEFLCAKMQSGDRLWWMKHSTSQSVAQPEAQCQWPCDIGRPCTSPGGILKDDGSVSESTSDAQRILDACPKPSNNNNNNNNNGGNQGGYGQPSMPSNQGGNQGGYPQPTQPPMPSNQGGYAQPSGSYNSQPSYGGNGGSQGGNGGNGQVVGDNTDDLFRIPDNDNPCQGAADGSFVPNPKYCNVFHVCVSGVRKDFLCAKGSSTYDLWWNDATKQCEWPCKIQCSKQIFGSSSSASDIANMDRNLNPALCGGGSTGGMTGGNGGNGGNGGLGGYGNQFTQPPQTFAPQTLPPQTLPPQTFPPQTQAPATQPPNNNNNNYGGYGGYGNYYYYK